MNIKSKELALVFAAVVLTSSVSYAETSSTQLIVRYRAPQNTGAQAKERALLTTRNSNVATELVNAEEGVVRLSFATPAEAEDARERLVSLGEVESVSANLLYRPAMVLRWRTVNEEESTGDSFLFPFGMSTHTKPKPTPGTGGTIPVPGIPDVQLPSGHVIAGDDPLADKDWALTSIKMPSVDAVQTIFSRPTPITAAVIDTGVDYNHEDLIGAMWRDPSNPKVVGYDFAHDTDKPWDNMHFDLQGCIKDPACSLGINAEKFLVNPGHGTHCAGHVGAVANNSVGIRGVGAGVKVMGLKFFYDFGEQNAGQGDDAAAIKSIDFAIKNGVKVISASWGGREKRADGEASELKQALIRAQKAGVLVVIAAGNDGVDQDKVEDPDYPAAYDLDNLIVVAAVDQADNIASFSNYGAKSVHIAAPGVKILSTTVGSHYDDVVASFTDSQGKKQTMDWDGTSMATPIVAGAAALLWAKNPTATYQEIRQKLLSTVRPVAGLSGKVSSGGVLNVSAALGL